MTDDDFPQPDESLTIALPPRVFAAISSSLVITSDEARYAGEEDARDRASEALQAFHEAAEYDEEGRWHVTLTEVTWTTLYGAVQVVGQQEAGKSGQHFQHAAASLEDGLPDRAANNLSVWFEVLMHHLGGADADA